MVSIHPKGEKVRQAVKWVSEKMKYEEGSTIAQLLLEAATQFNLSPKDEEFLKAFYKTSR